MADNERVVYRGEVFAVLNTGRYYCSGRHGGKYAGDERLLHRRVWSDHYGKIPDGHTIHHIDGNWRNNEIENLECIPFSEHARMHMRERFKSEEYRVQNSKSLELAKEAAKAWHASEKGREWHSQHGRSVAAGLPYTEYVCIVCGKSFLSRNPRGSKTCSRTCGTAIQSSKAKIACESECRNCGTMFRHPKPRRGNIHAFCSRKCSAIAHNRNRIQPNTRST